MSVALGCAIVFVGVVVFAVVGIVVFSIVGRSFRTRFEKQVRQLRESGCTCDYTFVEAWGATNVTRKHDCPVHGRKGTNG
jgi:hypothetical protein